MYNFPEKTKLNKLINQRLEVISCTANQVIFEFSNKIKIDATAGFLYSNGLGDIEEVNVPIDTPSIFGLLEFEVSNVDILNDKKEMVIAFKNKEELRFFSDEMYESVYIYFGDERIIV